MLRKILCGSALAGLLFVPVGARSTTASAQAQAQQHNAQSKSAAGTVTAIGADKKSFSMDVNDNSNTTKPMQFVIDPNTQVQGRVGVGTKAVVQYQPTDDGKNLAISVAPQNSQ
jgi:hypothetical protein